MPTNVIIWTVYEVINNRESIGITFEVFTFVVSPLWTHFVMTSFIQFKAIFMSKMANFRTLLRNMSIYNEYGKIEQKFSISPL